MNVLLSQYNFHEAFIKDALEPYIKENHHVVILPFSFHEEKLKNHEYWIKAYSKETGKYYSTIVEPFKAFGIKEENIMWINYFTDKTEEMTKKIENSDILFLTGGLPDKYKERIKEKGIEGVIKQYRNLIIGASAGALIQLDEYYLSPDRDYESFSYYKGLGLIKTPFHIQVHYDHSTLHNKCIDKALSDNMGIVYAITDHGGLLVDKDEIKVLGDVIVKSLDK